MWNSPEVSLCKVQGRDKDPESCEGWGRKFQENKTTSTQSPVAANSSSQAQKKLLQESPAVQNERAGFVCRPVGLHPEMDGETSMSACGTHLMDTEIV